MDDKPKSLEEVIKIYTVYHPPSMVSDMRGAILKWIDENVEMCWKCDGSGRSVNYEQGKNIPCSICSGRGFKIKEGK